MSDRAHRILGALAALLFAAAGALMHTHHFPSLDWLWQVIMEVSGGGAIAILKPLMGKGDEESPKLDGIETPKV